MAAASPFALAQMKRAVLAGADMPLPAALAYENQLFAACFATPEQKAAMQAFLSRKK